MTAQQVFFLGVSMRLSARLRDAMVWLGEPPTASTFVTAELLEQLKSHGVIECDPDGTVRFTPAGAQTYRDTVGHWPARNV